MTVVTGKAFWAKLDEPKNQFDPLKPRWSLDVALNTEGVKFMKGLGIPIKDKDDDRGKFVTMYKDQYLRSGKELPKPRVVDSQKNDISGTLIGNGSLVKVSFQERKWDMNNKQGVRAVLKDVQVIDLLEYVQADEFEVEEGYTNKDSSNTSDTTDEFDDIPFE